jgi:predicted sugar kinase
MCELVYVTVILKKCQKTQSSNPEPIIIRHGIPNSWQYVFWTREVDAVSSG